MLHVGCHVASIRRTYTYYIYLRMNTARSAEQEKRSKNQNAQMMSYHTPSPVYVICRPLPNRPHHRQAGLTSASPTKGICIPSAAATGQIDRGTTTCFTFELLSVIGSLGTCGVSICKAPGAAGMPRYARQGRRAFCDCAKKGELYDGAVPSGTRAVQRRILSDGHFLNIWWDCA